MGWEFRECPVAHPSQGRDASDFGHSSNEAEAIRISPTLTPSSSADSGNTLENTSDAKTTWKPVEPSSADTKKFLKGVFAEYATGASKTSAGNPLMNCPDLKAFFRDFSADACYIPTVSKQEMLYYEELELQKDTRFRFDLSRAEAARGLCFETFEILLAKALPNGLAHKMARDLYCRYAGSASRAARN